MPIEFLLLGGVEVPILFLWAQGLFRNLLRIVIRYGDDSCANTIFLGFDNRPRTLKTAERRSEILVKFVGHTLG